MVEWKNEKGGRSRVGGGGGGGGEGRDEEVGCRAFKRGIKSEMNPSSRNELLPSSKEKEKEKDRRKKKKEEEEEDGKCFGERDEDGWLSE
ncbi:hypothetical protein M0802_000157 [Mischocyttarus mexicanus]|nr:hypothetical protein M0802_000157 [Mischocyttarus mexicanus]